MSAQHLYPEEGTYAISVTIADQAGHVTVANSHAVVADAVLGLSGQAISATEGQGFTGAVVAALTDTNPGASPTDFTGGITIDWGDGSHSEGQVVQTSPGTFDVLGDHTYAEVNGPGMSNPPPPYTVTVTVLDQGGSRVSAQTQADVEDAQPLVLSSTNTGLESVEGQRLSNVALVTFADPNHLASINDYKATIDWGDGSPIDTGVVTLTGDNATGTAVTLFQVSGSHTYAEESTSYTSTVTVVDVDSPDKPLIATVSIPVGDAPLETEGAPSIPANPGVSTGVVTVATVLDANPHPDLSDFTATIDWGDGSATPGSVNAVGTGTGQTIYIEGEHTYFLPGDYQIKTLVNDAGGSSTIALAEAVTPGGGGVIIGPPPTPDPESATYVTQEGGFNTGTVATFTYSDPNAVPSDFSVTLDWGDYTGIDTNGTISVSGTGAGQTFTVQGIHLYAKLGTYPVSVQITDKSGHVGIANSKAVVADAPLIVATLPPDVASLTVNEGQPLTNIEVASFLDANFFSLPSDFEATIDWGDGSPPFRRDDHPTGRILFPVRGLGKPHLRRGERDPLRHFGHNPRDRRGYAGDHHGRGSDKRRGGTADGGSDPPIQQFADERPGHRQRRDAERVHKPVVEADRGPGPDQRPSGHFH